MLLLPMLRDATEEMWLYHTIQWYNDFVRRGAAFLNALFTSFLVFSLFLLHSLLSY